jgi:hypothetical protein
MKYPFERMLSVHQPKRIDFLREYQSVDTVRAEPNGFAAKSGLLARAIAGFGRLLLFGDAS